MVPVIELQRKCLIVSERELEALQLSPSVFFNSLNDLCIKCC